MSIFKSAIKKFFIKSKYDLIHKGNFQKRLGLLVREIEALNNLCERKVEKHPVDQITCDMITKLSGITVSEALYIVHMLQRTKEVKGDVCEFGVAEGNTSLLIANEIAESLKSLWLYDSFCGLPKPSQKDTLRDDIFGLGSMSKYEGLMASDEGFVKKKLKLIHFPPDRAHIVKGFVHGVIPDNKLPEKISFAFIDFDFYQPIKDVLMSIHPRLSEGSIIMVDDYDFFSDGAKLAVDEYVENNRDLFDFIVPDKAYGCFCVLIKK
ncbi:MAG: TylF/MycF family methyltransferase [Gammaproteobacteria bacterium]|nr:TylF/MycF family methyltransferase [Gammaproteobacteria bacterium]